MPRKTSRRKSPTHWDYCASMRPRPDAAENLWMSLDTCQATVSFNEAAARCRGKPSSPRRWPACSSPCFNEAAARCRGKPQHLRVNAAGTALASMRPRPDAAENRGPGRGPLSGAVAASMRPRPDAAENRRAPPPVRGRGEVLQ